jgi:hypothetical protein
MLVANELTSYRQTIAFVIRKLHPHIEVFEAPSESLDEEVARLGPDLVICSRVTHTVRRRVANWVELYPDCKPYSTPYSTFCVGGERESKEDVQLSDLLSRCASLP